MFTNVVLIVLGLIGLLIEGVSYSTIRSEVLEDAAPATPAGSESA